jgi:PHP family Zn ribbon phosphoesterase
MQATLTSPIDSKPLLEKALEQPNGARFYRCALQVNPYSYLKNHEKPTIYADESSYNAAIIQACQAQNIEVLAITDHYQVDGSESLAQAARNAGLFVFSGFEAVSKDGVHYLCLFDDVKTRDELIGILGECGVHVTCTGSPTGNKDSQELLECIRRHGGICIAAHVAADQGGLLGVLKGRPRVNVWVSNDLLACSIPGTIDNVQQNYRPILLNQDEAHRRARPIAILNAQDVSDPQAFEKQGSSCLIKMSSVGIEGLRQAFLDPESRIRLLSDEIASPHAEFLAMSWEGGFLDGTTIHFNENLNVLVGGRGTGKSTIIESIRAVLDLDPKGEEAKKSHSGMLKHVLKSGTKISLLVRSNRPTQSVYVIERIVPNPAVVKDGSKQVLPLKPIDILQNVEVFGQHEISELARDPVKRTSLLNRFIVKDPSKEQNTQDVISKLKRSRTLFLEAKEKIQTIDERLAALPALEETLKRYQQAGLEEKMKDKTLLIREEGIFKTAKVRLISVQEVEAQLRKAIPLDISFLSPEALDVLPAKDTLSGLLPVLEAINTKLSGTANNLGEYINETLEGIEMLLTQWQERKTAVNTQYEATLRALQTTDVNAEEFVQLKQQIEELRPLSESKASLDQELNDIYRERLTLLSEWEGLKAERFRAIEKAAKKVTKALEGHVRVEVTNAGNREPLYELLKKEVVGLHSSAIERLSVIEDLSLIDFSNTCTIGKDELRTKYSLPSGAAEKIAQAPLSLALKIEELELPATTKLFLNVAAEGQPPVWKSLEELSTGQKATAILLLLLLKADAPLIVDQPEDDLDNRFITDCVVPIMRREKCQRQFVFSTHNANIPVLGDAELIIGLTAEGEDQGRILPEYSGSLDSLKVQELVEEILEGGKAAFEMRRAKYGF